MRRTTPPSASALSRPWPAAARVDLVDAAELAGEAPHEASVARRRPMRTGGAARAPRGGPARAPRARPRRARRARPRSASASTRVVAAAGAGAAARVSGVEAGDAAGAGGPGDRRSGSGIRMSRPMAAGRPAAIGVDQLARAACAATATGRGARRLASSISTMTTGGRSSWRAARATDRRRSSARRSGPSGARRRHEQHGDQRRGGARARGAGRGGPSARAREAQDQGPPRVARRGPQGARHDAQTAISRPSQAEEISTRWLAARDLLEPARLPQHGGDLLVVVDRLVVEHAEVLGPRELASSTPTTLLEWPQSSFTEIGVGERVHGVEDHEVGVAEELDERLGLRAGRRACARSRWSRRRPCRPRSKR